MRIYHHRVARYRRISPRALRIGLIVLGLVLLIDTMTLHFSAQIEAVLTLPLPAKHSGTGNTSIMRATSTPARSTTPVGLASKNMLAQDTFQRANQVFWGIASDGQSWRGDAMSARSFAILNHTGQVANASGVYDAILGPSASDAEIVCSGSLSRFASSNLGALIRWTDADNLYKAFIDGTHLTLLKKAAGAISVLQTTAFTAQDGKSYTLRVRAVGPVISAKVWPTSEVEPAGWMLVVTDTSLQAGYGGLRLIVQSGITATITSFMELKL